MKSYNLFTGPGCNNRCVYCCESIVKSKNKLSLSQLKKKILLLNPSDYDILTLIGGESTIRKDIFEIVNFAKNHGFKRIEIITNGRMYKYKSFILELVKAGCTRFTISISSHTQKLYKEISRSDGFYDVDKGLSNLFLFKDKKIIKEPISTITVISKLNYKFLPKIIEYIKNKGVDNIRLEYVRSLKPNDRRYGSFSPKMSNLKTIFSQIKKQKIPISLASIPYCIVGPEVKRTKISTKSYGDIYEQLYFKKDSDDLFIERKKQQIKNELCNSCIYDYICDGIWKEYVKVYGFDEFTPVKNN